MVLTKPEMTEENPDVKKINLGENLMKKLNSGSNLKCGISARVSLQQKQITPKKKKSRNTSSSARSVPLLVVCNVYSDWSVVELSTVVREGFF